MARFYVNVKVGFAAGINGKSGDYFLTIVHNGGKTYSVAWHGGYGADYRMEKLLEGHGYKQLHVQNDFGRLAKRAADLIHKEEPTALDLVEGFCRGKK